MTELQRFKILVDGKNLQLTHGTGIRTYAETLVETLRALGGDVSVLFERHVAGSPDAHLAESMFYDEVSQTKQRLSRSKESAKALASMLGVPWTAKHIALSRYVVKGSGGASFAEAVSDFIDEVSVYNLPGCYDISERLFRSLRRSPSIRIPAKIDVFHATYPGPVSIRGVKKVTTIHDLIPLKAPYTTLDRKNVFCRQIQSALDSSELVITVSDSSRKDILEAFNVAPEKVVVTYQTCGFDPKTKLAPESVERRLKMYQLDPGKFILFVGAIEPKKNVGRLIDAFAQTDTDLPLVIVGPKAWLWKEQLKRVDSINSRSAHFGPRIRLLGHVPREDLQALYVGATCMAFPSIYEGFGLPPLEAMSLGCPVLTSPQASLPEVCGDAAVYADPFDVSDIQAKLENLIHSPALRNSLKATGREQAKFFSRENYRQRLYDAYAKLLDLPRLEKTACNISPVRGAA